MSHQLIATSGDYSGVENCRFCHDTSHDVLKGNADLEQYVRKRCQVKKIILRRKVGKYDAVENVHHGGEKAHRGEIKRLHEMLKDRFFQRAAEGKLGDEEFELIDKEEADETYDADEEGEKAIEAKMTKSVRFAQ